MPTTTAAFATFPDAISILIFAISSQFQCTKLTLSTIES
jgi:hypothetical protein